MLAQEKKDGDSIITPSELAILNCLMDGGFILSLKVRKCCYVDLSFIDARVVFFAVYRLSSVSPKKRRNSGDALATVSHLASP